MGLTWSFLVRFHVVRWLGPVHQVGGRGGLGPLETDVAAPRNSIYRGGRCEKRSANDPIIGRRRLLQRPPFFFVVAVAEAVRLLGSFFFCFSFLSFFFYNFFYWTRRSSARLGLRPIGPISLAATELFSRFYGGVIDSKWLH